MKEFKESYYTSSDTADDFQAVAFSVWCYRGNVATPMWEDIDASESPLTINLFGVLDEVNILQIITRSFVLLRLIYLGCRWFLDPKLQDRGVSSASIVKLFFCLE